MRFDIALTIRVAHSHAVTLIAALASTTITLFKSCKKDEGGIRFVFFYFKIIQDLAKFYAIQP